jgi:hypothetical protein
LGLFTYRSGKTILIQTLVSNVSGSSRRCQKSFVGHDYSQSPKASIKT